MGTDGNSLVCGGRLTNMANSMFKLLDELLLAAWLLELAQIKSDELGPVH